MRLTASDIENAAPGEKTARLFDGGGLYLEIAPTGGKWWRIKYRFERKDKRLALGAYPAVSLADARERRDAAKRLLGQGVDPLAVRREGKARQAAEKLVAKDASRVYVAAAVDGAVEIWKGGAVMCLNPEEAVAVRDLLTKLTA